MSTDLLTARPLSAYDSLSVSELARACGAETDWVLQLVEVGIIESHPPAERLADWRFEDKALRCALKARRLQRDFGVELDAAALILDLENEIRRLKAVLVMRGLPQNA